LERLAALVAEALYPALCRIAFPKSMLLPFSTHGLCEVASRRLICASFRDLRAGKVHPIQPTIIDRIPQTLEPRMAIVLRSFVSTTVAAAFALAATAALAGPSEAASSAASQASAVATKVEKSVKHGLKTAASAVEHGASVAGHAVAKAAQKIGLPASSASSSR
jgi:hypothetical protein